ncbi:MoaD/ThiS family protein [candidate division KSB1 bacterium]|nr:MoaD/ThiS family protein [candidate division KSB1 bacterium]TDI88296.1 MAG: MoaD/ThiS family protein [Caldithrix sp.]
MKVTLRLFGQLRELAKCDEAEIEIKEGTKIGDLVWLVGERFPNMRQHLKVVSFSIDNDYASKETVLNEGNEVSLLPPISGG